MTSCSRVAFLLPSLNGGGAERTILKLADGFRSRGYKADLVLVHLSGPLTNEIPPGLNIVDLHAPRAFTSRALSSLPAVVGYLRRERPDILFTGLMTNLIAIWAKKLAGVRTKVIISERNILSMEMKQFPKDIRFRLMPLFVRLFYPHADGIVAVSRAVAMDLCQITGIPADKIRVIYNPVITCEIKESITQPLDHPWYAPGQPPVILSTGRLAPQKDYFTLLKAFAILRQSRSLRLIILGDGPERDRLKSLARELRIEKDVLLPGFTDNPYPFMKKSAIFVLSSKFEGLPGVLIEALFCGAPVVATDCPGGSREILADGRYGQLVPVGDPESMARAIDAKIAIDGHHPEPESWKPFELDHILDQYIDYFETIFSSAQ